MAHEKEFSIQINDTTSSIKMKKPFKLIEVKPNIFCLKFNNHYDMCMTFLRYQEFYESPSSQFRGKSFRILDFMRWYSLAFGKGAFTYPIDWSGFNIPDYVLQQVYDLGIKDWNDYDQQMWEVYQACKQQARFHGKFYIIGVTKGNGALDHEIAHGLFYLNAQYKKEMTKLVKQMEPDLRIAMNTYLKKVGYTPKVFIDETQANMATTEDFTGGGDYRRFNLETATKLIKAQKPFIEIFEKYIK